MLASLRTQKAVTHLHPVGNGYVCPGCDTSIMNVSISAVVEDLDTTVSAVQSAISLEALVSAAFILINSKVGDLIGRKRAYVLVFADMPSVRLP